MLNRSRNWIGVAALLTVAGAFPLTEGALAADAPSPEVTLPSGVKKICTIAFDADHRRPARVQDNAMACLESIARTLREQPDGKVVLVGVSDPQKDDENRSNGMHRDVEDKTGLNIRFEDIAAYRALNAKDYLRRYLRIDAARLIPTSNEARHGQEAAIYLVPDSADFAHNFLGATPINEHPCTVKPCCDPREKDLRAQRRERIRVK